MYYTSVLSKFFKEKQMALVLINNFVVLYNTEISGITKGKSGLTETINETLDLTIFRFYAILRVGLSEIGLFGK